MFIGISSTLRRTSYHCAIAALLALRDTVCPLCVAAPPFATLRALVALVVALGVAAVHPHAVLVQVGRTACNVRLLPVLAEGAGGLGGGGSS